MCHLSYVKFDHPKTWLRQNGAETARGEMTGKNWVVFHHLCFLAFCLDCMKNPTFQNDSSVSQNLLTRSYPHLKRGKKLSEGRLWDRSGSLRLMGWGCTPSFYESQPTYRRVVCKFFFWKKQMPLSMKSNYE